jgi:hypothetical protein
LSIYLKGQIDFSLRPMTLLEAKDARTVARLVVCIRRWTVFFLVVIIIELRLVFVCVTSDLEGGIHLHS